MADIGDPLLRKDADGLPKVLRGPTHLWLDRLADAGLTVPDALLQNDETRICLMRLVAASEYASGMLLREWDWFSEAVGPNGLDRPAAVSGDVDPDAPFGESIRRQRHRSLLRILWGIIDGDDIWTTLSLLSAVADTLITRAGEEAAREVSAPFGLPRDADGNVIPFIVLAMGKLGGGELNFSSDVDLVFLYGGEGETDGARSLSAHEYFTRLSRRMVRYLDDVTEHGFVYRVDTRLRPFGESGPPVLGIGALENYLLQHGRSWERYAYVKARVVGETDAATESEMYSTIIEPFVFRQYLDYGVFESLRDMKSLIEREVQKRELAANIKLGPGGIREIEFIAQSLQLVRGGANRALRCRDIRSALERLGNDRGIGREASESLRIAYEFLRRFENGIQAIRDQQTHDVPGEPIDQARLCLMMGYDAWEALAEELDACRERVATHFDAVAFRGTGEQDRGGGIAAAMEAPWRSSTTGEEWIEWLATEGFEEAEQVGAAARAFANAPVQRQVDVTGEKRLERFIQTLFPLLKKRRHPGVTIERVLAVVTQIARRSAYVALLNENTVVLERLVDLCEQSAYLAREIEKFPALLDELLDPRLYSESISAVNMQADLDERLRQVDVEDSEAVIERLAQFQRASLFRIAVADVSRNLPIMKVSDHLTELAELVLKKALDIAWRDLVARHGEPRFRMGSGYRKAGFAVIAYGKLGGMELSYQSDLDLVFLHDATGESQETDGERPIDNSLFFGRLVRRLVHFLTTQTQSGALYEVDTRLRPSGRSGLLVVSTEGFARYQEDNAWTWEHQALLRSRPVAGSASIARHFEKTRTKTLRHRVRRDTLLDDVLSMRQKMRDKLDRSSADRFDLKQGEGGIGDIEFLVQYLVLCHADDYPALVYYSDNIRQLGVLEAVGLLPASDVARLQQIYRAYRLRSHRLALDELDAIVGADEFGAERVFVSEIWRRTMQ